MMDSGYALEFSIISDLEGWYVARSGGRSHNIPIAFCRVLV
jgi:hypothetical protein